MPEPAHTEQSEKTRLLMRLSASRVGVIDAVGSMRRNVSEGVQAVRPAPALLAAVSWGGVLLAAWRGYRSARKSQAQDGVVSSPLRTVFNQLLAIILPQLVMSAALAFAPSPAEKPRRSSLLPLPPLGDLLTRRFYRWLGLEK